jgi:hypothetical protein
VALIAFVLFGNPSAGPYPGSFVPGFWRVIGPWLPGGAALSALRGTVYFGGTAVGRPLGVLALYLVVGIVATVALGARRNAHALEVEIMAVAAAA